MDVKGYLIVVSVIGWIVVNVVFVGQSTIVIVHVVTDEVPPSLGDTRSSRIPFRLDIDTFGIDSRVALRPVVIGPKQAHVDRVEGTDVVEQRQIERWRLGRQCRTAGHGRYRNSPGC